MDSAFEQKPLRVLFVTRKWPPAIGGMETYSLELTEELAHLTELEVRKLPGRDNGLPPSAWALMTFLFTTSVFLARRKNDYDIVHFGDLVLFPLAWISSLFSPQTKRVVTVHGLDLIFGNRSGITAAIYRGYLWFARNQRKALELIIANSSNTARIAKQQGFGDAVPIPLGVRLKPNNVEHAALSAPDGPFVLFVGRLVPRKGASWFALNVLPLLADDIRLKVVGKIWDKEEGRRLAEAEKVDLLGYVDETELESLRKSAIAIVMPNQPSTDETDVEGFGITALEAAGTGTPLVASNIEGITDAVIDGETGFLEPNNDVGRWLDRVNQLRKWNDDERTNFAKRAKKAIEQNYSWQRVARDTVQAYMSVANDSSNMVEPDHDAN